MAREGPAGSLCWFHGCPSVSAGAGLGLPGRAVRYSVGETSKAGGFLGVAVFSQSKSDFSV